MLSIELLGSGARALEREAALWALGRAAIGELKARGGAARCGEGVVAGTDGAVSSPCRCVPACGVAQTRLQTARVCLCWFTVCLLFVYRRSRLANAAIDASRRGANVNF